MAVATRRRPPAPEDGLEEEPAAQVRRRRVADEEPAEETPRRRRPAAVEDDEEQEDPQPRRRRPAAVEDDEEQEDPQPRRRAVAYDDGADEEEFEDPPARGERTRRAGVAPSGRAGRRPGPSGPSGRAGRRPGPSAPAGRVASGWGGYQRVKSAASDFEAKYKPSESGDVIMLLEPEPFAAFARHWIGAEGSKRAFLCPASLETENEDDDPLECPLCDVGDKPNGAKAYMNVAVLKRTGRPEHAVWEIGSSISDQLQTIDKSIGRRTKLNDIYLLASSTGSKLNTRYQLEPIFDDDLPEFELAPLTEKQLAAFELYDASLYEVPSLKELNQVADEIA